MHPTPTDPPNQSSRNACVTFAGFRSPSGMGLNPSTTQPVPSFSFPKMSPSPLAPTVGVTVTSWVSVFGKATAEGEQNTAPVAKGVGWRRRRHRGQQRRHKTNKGSLERLTSEAGGGGGEDFRR